MPHGNTKLHRNWLESKDRQGYHIGGWCEQDPNDALKLFARYATNELP